MIGYLSLGAQSPGEKLFDTSYVHEIYVYFEQDDFWDELTENYVTEFDIERQKILDATYLMCDVVIDGVRYDSVGIRQKGVASNQFYPSDKKPLKFDVNEFVKGKKIDGLKKFNLANGFGDPSIQRDFIGYEVFRSRGIPVPRVSYTKVFLNDEFWGIYAIIEQIDKTFVGQRFSDNDGNLYKSTLAYNHTYEGDSASDYNTFYDLKTNEEENDYGDFIDLIKMIDLSDDETFRDSIDKIFDVESYLKIVGIDVVLDNWDGHLNRGRNSYIYNNPDDDRHYWIPWDYNLCMGASTSGFERVEIGNINPDDLNNCNTIKNGTSPYPVDDPVFAKVVEEIEFCCIGTWEDFCQERYDEIVLGDTLPLPQNCLTILSGSSPYPPDDSIFLEVIKLDNGCCESKWDQLCEDRYNRIVNKDSIPYVDYTIGEKFNRRKLIRRLRNIPEYEAYYRKEICVTVQNVFSEERLFPILDRNRQLIESELLDEPFIFYPAETVQYDFSNKDSQTVVIPAMKQYIRRKRARLIEEMDTLGITCRESSEPIAQGDVVINEFVASADDEGNIEDPSGENEDWIELYNTTSSEIELSDYFLTDDIAIAQKWAFPEGTTIDSEGYLIIWCDEDDDQEGLHALFKLSKGGEYIGLTHTSGVIIDSINYPEQETNVAYARIPNGTGNFVSQEPTIGGNNDGTSSTSDGEIADVISLFPSPVQNRLEVRIELNTVNSIPYSIYDMMGRKWISNSLPLNQNNVSIDVRSLPAGSYIFRYGIEGRRAIKFVKK